MRDETYSTLEDYVRLKAEEATSFASIERGPTQETSHAQYMEALTLLKDIEKDNADYYDKQERREIERKKNDDATKVEESKQNVSGKRFVLEIAKVVVPVLTGVISAVTVLKMQDKAGKFEESGSWPSKASQMTFNQAPRVWK